MTKINFPCLVLIAFLFTSNLYAQTILSVDSPRDIQQYARAEWQVRLKAGWTNPYAYTEQALDMILRTPSGKELVQPCFYVSGNPGTPSQWQARFTPREAGRYTCRFVWKEKGRELARSVEQHFIAGKSRARGFLQPHDLWTLRYDDGTPFRGVGENICWESRDEDDSKYFEALHEDNRFNYDYMVRKLAANGGNFFRVWMVYWNLAVDWKKVKNNARYRPTESPCNESGMERMDQLVRLCDSLGVHMMVALESHVGFMGEGWEMSSYNVVNGGPAKIPLDFFTLEAAKQQYKNKLRLIIARYGSSPAIGAWEFFNEIDNAMYHGKPEDRIPDDVITRWHDEMSRFLKEQDAYKHMVTTSISHRDVAGMNDLMYIDLNQKHIYKNTAGIPETIQRYTRKHQKPYVIGESGYEWDWSKNFNDFADSMDADFTRALWLGMFSPTPILPMSWWWEFFEHRGMMRYFKPVSEVNRMMLASGNGRFSAMDVRMSGNEGRAMAVQCGKDVYTYLESPRTDSAMAITYPNLPPGLEKIRCLNPDTGEWSESKIMITEGNRVYIPLSFFGNAREYILVLQ
jgi:hypothetical protein